MSTTTPTGSSEHNEKDNSTTVSQNKCYVLYVDHQGHPAPIDETYHATASRRLSSAIINRGYPSTIQNVDSAYCPQCLTVYTELGGGSNANNNTNAGGYYCSKSTCKLCPLCLSIASIRFEKNDDDPNSNDQTTIMVYGCGNCGWSSKECNVYIPVPSPDGEDEQEMGRLEMIRAADELGTELSKQKRRFNDPFEQYWHHLLRSWAEETGTSSGGRYSPRGRQNRGGANTPRTMQGGDRSSPPQQRLRGRVGRRSELKAWSLETLEASLNEKKKKLFPVLDDHEEEEDAASAVRDEDNDDDAPSSILDNLVLQPPKGLQIKRISIKSIKASGQQQQDDDKNSSILADIPLFSYQQQVLLNCPFVLNVNNKQELTSLLPLQIPLRLRTSRRCRAELAEGRPGILLKPKLNPLEGDSSLRTGHGQWHKKDCSAIAIIPRIHIVQHKKRITTEKSTFVFLIKVSNPTLGTVRLRFTSSKYTGEPVLFPDDESKTITTNLPDLVVDTTMDESLLPTIVHATLQQHVLEDLATTDTIELLSSEDSIIELGSAKARETPIPVLEWDKKNTASSGASSSTMRLVAQSASDAWFELLAIHPKQQGETLAVSGSSSSSSVLLQQNDATRRQCLAFPISLQVELGNGSWESSLIPPSTTTTETDYVTFDLVLIC